MSTYNTRDITRSIILNTPSDGNMLIVVFSDGSVEACRVGRYGGFLCKPKPINVNPVAGFYPTVEKENEEYFCGDRVEELARKLPEVRGLVEKLRDVGFDFSRCLTLVDYVYRYNVVDVVVRKRAERYMVVDIGKEVGKAGVRVAKVCYVSTWSRSGRGYDPEGIEKFRIAARLAGFETTSDSCGRRCMAACVLIPVDTGELEEIVSKVHGAAREEVEVIEEEEEEGEEASVGVELATEELEVELEEGEAGREAAAEASREAEEAPKRQELVKVYLLKMSIPTPDLVAKYTRAKNVQIRDYGSDDKIRAALASRLNGLRRTAYDKISHAFVYVDEFGVWLAVSEDAVKHAEEVSKWVRRELLNMPALMKYVRRDEIERRYGVKAIPVYLEPEHARELLLVAYKKLLAEVTKLEAAIRRAEEERKKSTLRKYEKRMEYKRALLEALRRYIVEKTLATEEELAGMEESEKSGSVKP